LNVARGDFATLTQAATLLSCGLPEVPAILGKTLEERRAQHGNSKRLEDRLAEHEARALLASHAAEGAGARVVSAAMEDATPDYLKLLAGKLCGEAQVVALLASRSSGQVVFAQTKGGSGDMGALLREMLKEFGGKGGGAKDFAQGSVSDLSKMEEVLARAREKL
jgi:alanyl-tRNA synthetase